MEGRKVMLTVEEIESETGEPVVLVLADGFNLLEVTEGVALEFADALTIAVERARRRREGLPAPLLPITIAA